MTGIKGALTRKFGPLPAWAWLTITAAVVYFWRSRGGGGTVASATGTGDTTAPEPSAPRDPVTLQPGESVYDPNTGQLIGTAPEQQPGETPEAVAPLAPDPVEAPSPMDEPAAAAAHPAAAATKKPGPFSRAKAAVLTGRVGPENRRRLRAKGYSDRQIDYHAKRKTALGVPQSKKKPKPKAQHTPPKPVKHPTATKKKTRTGGAFRKPADRKPPVTHPPKKTRPARAKPTVAAPSRARSHPVATPKAVIRQRPAPAQTTPRTPPKKTRRRK